MLMSIAKYVIIPSFSEDLGSLAPCSFLSWGPDLKLCIFFFRHMGESWPVEESRETVGLEQWIRILILVKGKQG